MIFTESIYFVIIFMLPAAIHLIYHAYIRFSPRIQKDKSIELAESITFCVVVFIVCIFLFGDSMKEFAQYLLLSANEKALYNINNPEFNYLDFIVEYTCVTFIVSIATICAWYGPGKKFFHRLINFINKKAGRPTEEENSEIWRVLFESNKKINIFNCCLVIEKSGSLITAGFLESFQAPHLDNREFLLYNTEQTKEILKKDSLKSPEDRILYPALYEYYDVDSDILIKFYATEKLKEIWYPPTES